MSNYIVLFEIFSMIILGLMAIFVPIWALGNAQWKKYTNQKIEKYNEVLHSRITAIEKSHVHEEFCDERSGHIKSDISSMKG